MITEKTYSKILTYFDDIFYQNKVDETNWNYQGLILDEYFDNSILSIDYLNMEDFFDYNGGFIYLENRSLKIQFGIYIEKESLVILENILNVLKYTTINRELNNKYIQVITNILLRDNISVINPDNGLITLKDNHILDSGSYCNIYPVAGNILRKALKPKYAIDLKLQKRMKYEFENMMKLKDCPQILNVLEFNINDNSYTMEKGDENLFDFLNIESEVSFNEKIKIVFDVLQGIAFAHEKSIIHRDLHLGNILRIGNDFVICDFGLSKDLSIERSMKTSFTEKNNHIFVDPLAMNDFRQLDKKSDIYSIGKLIDYIFTIKENNVDHPFKNIVERCISRNREIRYDSVKQILEEINNVMKVNSEEENIKTLIQKIQENYYDSQVHQIVMNLVNDGKISKFIVTHNLYNFSEIIEKFESGYQVLILEEISNGYSEATGYKGWGNYDIFANIAYTTCKNSDDREVIEISRVILEECAKIRFSANNLLENLNDYYYGNQPN